MSVCSIGKQKRSEGDRIADATGFPIDAATRDFRCGIGAEPGMQHRTPGPQPFAS